MMDSCDSSWGSVLKTPDRLHKHSTKSGPPAGVQFSKPLIDFLEAVDVYRDGWGSVLKTPD
ncbi:hypothetical protein, partial [Corynebacterium sp. HMSC072G08]|uniref:hypothetical protein n=1 Tax=Corynebacterium sp. HMSC072G08 TaxID=1715039 RepID=UPI001AEF72ED